MADHARLTQIRTDLLALAEASLDPREARILVDAAQQISRLTGEAVHGAVVRDLIRAAADRHRKSV